VALVQGGDWEGLVRAQAPALWRLASAIAGPDAAPGIVADAFAAVAGDAGSEQPVELRLTRALWAAAEPQASAGVTPPPPAADAGLFIGENHRWAGEWERMPVEWDALSEAGDPVPPAVVEAAREAVRSLRADLRFVLALRDREGWTSGQVCRLFEMRPETERHLLDTARWHVLRSIDRALGGQAP
jgi:DNA-directed RNA polymerase specialized sigma24 family protein